MIAGTETTATALAGTTYYLLQSPSSLTRLASEIRSEFSSMDDITFEQLARLPYLHSVLQEGLRLYPPVPVILPRITPPGGIAIAGEWVPGGVTVGVHQVATYRSKANFTSPNEFHPERWLGDKMFANDALDSVEPFSVGPRNCLGKVRRMSVLSPSKFADNLVQNLAWHEMRLLLATVLLHFDVKICEESKDWSSQAVFSLWQKRPLLATLTPVGS
jgi:hypothetical protein